MSEADEYLLEQMSQGSTIAFETLFLRHYNRVYRVLYTLFRSREEAEDLAQETFLILYRNPPAPGIGDGLGAWLSRVALNRGYNTIRREKRARQRQNHVELPTEAEDPLAEAVRTEERDHVRAILAHLSERQSKLLLLRYAGMSYAEIAAILHIAPGSVGTLLARAERAFLHSYQHAGCTLEERKAS